MPPMIRLITRMSKLDATAQPNADNRNNAAEIIIVGFLPNLSLSVPATDTPKIEPTNAQPTYQPLSMVVKLNCELTWITVPEITAVSYPNKKPPNAATKDKKAT